MATPTVEKASKLNKYVVVADAVVVTVGKKSNGRPQYARVLRGGIVQGRDESETIQSFLQLGSIKQVSSSDELSAIRADLKVSTSRHRLTTRKIHKLSSAPDDPVQPALSEVQPLEASIERIDPVDPAATPASPADE